MICALCLFCAIALLQYIELESDESSAVRAHLDSTQMQKDILNLAKKYNIESKCLRIFCAKEEFYAFYDSFKGKGFKGFVRESIMESGSITESSGVNASSNVPKKLYYMHFSCDSVLCFEFLREIENLALVFIDEAHGFNVEITHIRDSNEAIESNAMESSMPKDSINEFLHNLSKDSIESKLPQNTLDTPSLPLEWKQDIRLIINIPNMPQKAAQNE